MGTRVPELDIGDLQVHFTEEVDGPPLVLLHAATSSATEDWAHQRPVLRQHFRLYLPDARGHAPTRWDTDQGWSHATLVADLLAFADALGLARFHAAGLSMGAGTALAYATRYPERLLEHAVRLRRQLPDTRLFSPGVGRVVVAEQASLFDRAGLTSTSISPPGTRRAARRCPAWAS